jgi:nickel/cobalt transporter (NicO) family protein
MPRPYHAPVTVRSRRWRLAPLAAAAALLGLPLVALAHPLGNFTVNVYAGLRVSTTEVRIDSVVDKAEIPTFQERLSLDTDGDGDLSDAEIDAAREPECRALIPSLSLEADGMTVPLQLVAGGLSFPPGAGGLSTLRLVCEFVAPLPSPVAGPGLMTFTNRVDAERLGWREITLAGDGTTVMSTGDAIPVESVSGRLTSYPAALLTRPFSQNVASFTVAPGGPLLPPPTIPDAQPIAGLATPSLAAASAAPAASTGGGVPGGVGAGIPSVFREINLSPPIILLALVTAIALGAAHALEPGHGKTLMAAYLVGSRGTRAHAVGLGLSVTIAHTIGILAIAVLVVAAQTALPPDVVVRWLPAIAAVTIAGIGGWMIVTELRRRRVRAVAAGHTHAEDVGTAPHEHGGVIHAHVAAGGTITWRSLFVLGLAGGIIPSPGALLILLSTIAAGRAAFGVVLVIAFGLGMALVLSGVGIAMIYARGRLERLPSSRRLARLSRDAPLVAGIVVLVLGVWLTAQAIASAPVF